MYVGIMKIEFRFHVVCSIKDKRKLINRIKMKVSSRFKVSIAEIADQEYYNSTVIGVTFICNKKDHAVSKGQNIITFLENNESDIFHDYDLVVEEYV